MLMTIKTPYVLHLNDSWEPIDGCSEKIERAYMLMETSQQVEMPVAQVLMNEQSSLECIYGQDISKCHSNNLFGKGGWSRRLTMDTFSIDFMEHEFGVQYPEHQQSASWPGFSSHHPALWNLNLLTSKSNVFYDENISDYDLIFAMKVLESGMVIAHLPDVGFQYMGK